MSYTVDQIKDIMTEAKSAAYEAADNYIKSRYNGIDQGSCGFSWVSIYKFEDKPIKGNTKIGKTLKAAGIGQNWNRTFEIWNPSGYPCQNIDTLEAGSDAAAKVLQKYGFVAYAGSRLD